MRLAALIGAAAICSPMGASAAALPVVLRDGAAWTQTISKTRIDERGGTTATATVTTVLQATYRKNGPGPATVELAFVSLESEGATATELAAVAGQAKLFYPAVVEVDQDLKPVRVTNWPKLKAAIQNIAQSASVDPKGVEAARGMFDKIDDRGAANFFKELALLSLGQGTDLEVGESATYDDQVPNLLGGPPIQAHGAFRLDSYDAASGRAGVTWTQTLDPGSAAASISATIDAMTSKLEPLKIAAAKAELAGLTFDRRDLCQYVVDTSTGLAVKAECSVATTTGVTGKTVKRTERWLITQTLPEKR